MIALIEAFAFSHIDECPALLCALEDSQKRIAKSIVAMPDELKNNAQFIASWAQWLKYRRRKRLTCTEGYLKKSLRELAAVGPDRVLTAIGVTMCHNLKHLHPEKIPQRDDHAGHGQPATCKPPETSPPTNKQAAKPGKAARAEKVCADSLQQDKTPAHPPAPTDGQDSTAADAITETPGEEEVGVWTG